VYIPYTSNSATEIRKSLTVTPVALGIETLPGLSPASSSFVVSVSLVQSSALLSGGGQSSAFSVLMDWLDDPIDSGISSDGLVLRVDEDDLVVLVGGVLIDPVGVEDSQVGTATADTLLSGRLEGPLVL